MAAKKRTPHQRQKDLKRISELYLRGWYQVDIAAEIGVAQSQISFDLAEIERQWLASAVRNFDEAKAKELAKIDELEREYWQAWEQSKVERTKSRQETDGKIGKDKKPIVKKMSMEKEQRDGNPAFLAGVMSCIDRRCKLTALDPATKTDNRNFEVDLSTLTDEQLDRLESGEDIYKVLKRG